MRTMADVTVYGAPWCPDCKRSKQFLSEQRIPFDWVDIDQSAEGARFVQERNDGAQTEPSSAPQCRTEAKLRMRAVLDSVRGKRAYARRKATVEPVFGQVRTRGFRQFSFRGLFKNRCEWLFVSLTHNLLKLFRAAQRASQLAIAAA